MDQQSYEGLALQVVAEANIAEWDANATRIDRGLHWVT